MDGKTVSIELEVDVESEISGLARNGAGPARPFSGWLGLMGVIDALLDGDSSAGRPTTPPSTEEDHADR